MQRRSSPRTIDYSATAQLHSLRRENLPAHVDPFYFSTPRLVAIIMLSLFCCALRSGSDLKSLRELSRFQAVEGGRVRRNWIKRFAVVAVIAPYLHLSVSTACAQSYPSKPVRVLVGFSAGGAADIITRLVAQKLTEPLGQAVIVENRPGAGGAIASERVAKSPPDGYTLLMMTAADTALPALRTKLPYNLERDLAPVVMVAISPFVLVVHPSVPARSVKELLALARSHPGKLSYASAGSGSVAQLAGELFKAMGQVDMVQVPFKGGAESVTATVSGQIDVNFPNITSTLPFLGSGKLVPLAVTTAKRVSLVPTIPTVSESGLSGYDCSGWWGLLAPVGVSRDVVDSLNMLVVKALNSPDMKEILQKQGFEPQTSTPEQLAARIREEITRNAKLLKLAGLKPE